MKFLCRNLKFELKNSIYFSIVVIWDYKEKGTKCVFETQSDIKMKLLAKIINGFQRLKTSINENFSAITDMELGAKHIQYKKNMQYSENFIF